MSTGLLLFLVFLALSIIDSVARVRRGQQQQAVPPPEEEGDEDWRAEPSSAQVEEQEAGRRDPGEALGELLGLEKLMGPGYVEKLMGPGVAGVMEEAEDVPEGTAPSARPEVAREAGPASPPERGERRVARAGLSRDQERRRTEARSRSSRGDQPPERDRRLPARVETGSRPVRAAREIVALEDSSASGERRRRAPLAAVAVGAERRSPSRTRLYRELFGGGGRDSLRRAFVLKEILDAPASERSPDRRDER